MTEFSQPNPERLRQQALEVYEAVKEIDPEVYRIADIATRLEPLQSVSENVGSILDDRGHRMCDVQRTGNLYRQSDPKKSAELELRAYHGDEKETSMYLFAQGVTAHLAGDRHVEGWATCEVMTDGRVGYKLVSPRAGEIPLSSEDETMVRLSLLKHFNGALFSLD